ncbi:MAG: hypothetical protein ACUVS7_13585 [Bryobacteraceae bacterium]
MIALGSAAPGPLVWKQSATTQRRYELRAGDNVVAELDFLKAFGTLARGRAATGAWTFKRTGFLSPIVTARREGESEDCAFYHPNFSASQGQLRLGSGEAFEFRLAGIWTRSAILIDNDRREVFRVHLKGEPQAGATVEVRLAETPGLELLLLLCWHVLVLQMQDESLRSAAR